MSSKNKIYILLGRTGDVLNLLPAIEYESRQHGYKPKFVVAKDYADVLDGCSYVEKVVFDGDFRNINEAEAFTRKKYPGYEIINCAVYGRNHNIQKLTSSFTREIWRLSGCPIPQNNLWLNFDKRNKERENIVFSVEVTKPILLIATNGVSSPFDYGTIMEKHIQEILKDKFVIINLSYLKAYRIYDLLKLYESAHCLIAIDSAPLHLANAVPKLPVISLISDNKDDWHQSAWRPNHILRLLYSEVTKNLNKIIEKVMNPIEARKIYFITSLSENPNPETKRRNALARLTREEERINSEIYEIFNYQDYERKSLEGMPYVKDMIDFISESAHNDDILMICNSDICFIPGITGKIIRAIDTNDAAFFHRWDMRKGKIGRMLTSEAELKGYTWYDGSDAFVFTKKWWIENREVFPDMIFGREYWDCIFRNMIKRSGGVEIHKAIYHEKHKGFWEIEKQDNPGNQENTILALEWFRKYGGKTADWRYKPEEWKMVYKYFA